MDMIQTQMREVLAETVRILFPLTENPLQYIKRHVWRNRKYIGESEKGVVVWKGFSTNLNGLSQKHQTLYINLVQNELSAEVSEELFGSEFYKSISEMSEYVTIYTTGFTEQHIKAIHQQGFVPRKVGQKFHAALVLEPRVFMEGTTKHWASDATRLANFACQLKFKPMNDIKKPVTMSVIEYWDDELNLLD